MSPVKLTNSSLLRSVRGSEVLEWSSDSDDADRSPADAPKESGVDDDTVYHDEQEITAHKAQAAARVRPVKLKIPSIKFLDSGQPEEVQKLRQYV